MSKVKLGIVSVFVVFITIVGVVFALKTILCDDLSHQLSYDIRHHTAFKHNPILERHNIELWCGVQSSRNIFYNSHFGNKIAETVWIGDILFLLYLIFTIKPRHDV